MNEKYVDTTYFFAVVEGELYRRGLRLNAFCDVLNVSRQTVWKWKRGRAVLPAHVFWMFCDVLGLEAYQFIKPDSAALMLRREFNDKFPRRF